MVCGSCHSKTRRISIIDGVEHCSNCSWMSEAGGGKTEGILTRNSFRVRRQQSEHEGDFVQPHSYDRTRKKVIPNPDFIKLYPKQSWDFYTPKEIAETKLNLPKKDKSKPSDVKYTGSKAKGIKRIIE